jgi:GNAT superfamily N-acetyltransferase
VSAREDDRHRWAVRSVELSDFSDWVRLFRDYAEFYERSLSDEQLHLVWSWIHDERAVTALLVVPAEGGGTPAGLAHLRSWIRPLLATRCGYLDDLFVDPSARGSGAVGVLFDAIHAWAIAQGWDIVRWTTAESNHRAQAAYDRVATRTTWVTYDMTPGAISTQLLPRS